MESTMRKEYLKSNEYKVVWLLSAYRRLCCLSGIEFSESVVKHRGKSVSKYFITLVDAGFEALDKTELMEYIRYIAKAMGYNPDKFASVLRDVVGYMAFSPSQEFDNQTLLKSLDLITNVMSD